MLLSFFVVFFCASAATANCLTLKPWIYFMCNFVQTPFCTNFYIFFFSLLEFMNFLLVSAFEYLAFYFYHVAHSVHHFVCAFKRHLPQKCVSCSNNNNTYNNKNYRVLSIQCSKSAVCTRSRAKCTKALSVGSLPTDFIISITITGNKNSSNNNNKNKYNKSNGSCVERACRLAI